MAWKGLSVFGGWHLWRLCLKTYDSETAYGYLGWRGRAAKTILLRSIRRPPQITISRLNWVGFEAKPALLALLKNLPILSEYAKFTHTIPRNSTLCRSKMSAQSALLRQTSIKRPLSESFSSTPTRPGIEGRVWREGG